MPAETPKTPRALWWGAVLFAGIAFLVSWWHWWTFQYGTFDLAFYVQALWLALRGQWQVSLLNVPLMGNHAEPIVFLLTPLFALWSHPMLFVAAQTLALASMPFTAWRIARRLQIERGTAILLALATVLTPATLLVGLHEFHPEALAAPLLLLLIEAKLAERRGWFWVWFVAVLGVKENLALLLVAWCVVFAVLEWRRGRAWLVRWNVLPGAVAAGWLLLCGRVIGPALNAGNVDYLQLYSHLGGSGGDIVRNFFTEPGRAFGALWHALTHGNLVWALVLPLLGLPFARLRWWFIAAPILGQHLLSWRVSEWSVGAHYPAPLIPLLWIATAEIFPKLRAQRAVAIAIVAACLACQVWVGPVKTIAHDVATVGERLEERAWKAEMLAAIPPGASVVASQPFLSHLAERERVLSLHHILKGLKTLSRAPYEPPAPTDVVIVDYTDRTTFSTEAGYYHPRMRTDAGRYVPSSDRLLHEFLRQGTWRVHARNNVAVFHRGQPMGAFQIKTPPVPFDETTTLAAMQTSEERPGKLRFQFAWDFAGERTRFPWMMLVLNDGKHLYPFVKGACAPEVASGRAYESWTVVFPETLPAATYSLYALFYDANEAAWQKKSPPDDPTFTLKVIELGQRQIAPGR